MELVDTHAHINDKRLRSIINDVLSRAQAAGVGRIVAVGTTLETSRQCIELAEQYSMVSAAVGIQPNCVAEAAEGDWEEIAKLFDHPDVCAIGETGLDRHWNDTPFAQQEDYFDRHLQASQATGLPFIVHMRECGEDVEKMLLQARERGPLKGVMHSFTGDIELMFRCVELGLYISFAGMVTYKTSSELRKVMVEVPDDRLLIETDSPYLSPEPKRNQRPNEPALVVHTAQCLADSRGIAVEELANIATQNAHALFSF